MEKTETLTYFDGEAVSDNPKSELSPEMDDNPTQIVYLSADPEVLEVLQNIQEELQQIKEIKTEELDLLRVQTTDYVNGSLAVCALIGILGGMLIMKGLWSGRSK